MKSKVEKSKFRYTTITIPENKAPPKIMIEAGT